VDITLDLTNLAPFVSARYAAVAHGSELTIIVSPETAKAISKLKVQTSNCQYLWIKIAYAAKRTFLSDRE